MGNSLRDRVADVIGTSDRLASTDREVHLEMADALIASSDDLFRGHFEQAIANEQVRQGQRQGHCPTCGADW